MRHHGFLRPRRGRLDPRRLVATLACFTLGLANCAGNDNDQAALTTTSTTTETSVTTTAGTSPTIRCDGLGPPPAAGEVTYVAGGRLFAVTPGGAPRCLLEVASPPTGPAWGGQADRVLLAPAEARVGDDTVKLALGRGETAGWSRPTGTSVLVVSEGRLKKRKVDSGAISDVSFLARHDEAVYHAGGLHIVSVGVHADGRYGIFVASNEGKDPRAVAVAETANRLGSLSWGPREALFFGAEHADNPPGDRDHVHFRPNVDGGLFTIPLPEGPVATVTASPFEELVAVQTGACPGGRKTETVDLDAFSANADGVVESPVRPVAVEAADTEPVGWLPGGRLVVLARPACGEPGSLWVVPIRPAGSPQSLAEQVESAGVRTILPESSGPPFEAGGGGDAAEA